ncbi:MAG: DUF1579 domain-containing protein [Acidobacteriota bacterium]
MKTRRSKRSWMSYAVLLLCVVAKPAMAAEPAKAPQMSADEQKMMEAYAKAGTPGPEHMQMGKMVGTWDMDVTAYGGPTPEHDKGTAEFASLLGGRVLTQTVHSTMMGQPYEGMGTQGYDNVSKKYWSIWMDSMSTGPLTSWGTCDAAGACTYEGTSNDPITGKAAKFHMTLKPDGADKQAFELSGPGPDGKQMKMMEIVYTRKK